MSEKKIMCRKYSYFRKPTKDTKVSGVYTLKAFLETSSPDIGSYASKI